MELGIGSKLVMLLSLWLPLFICQHIWSTTDMYLYPSYHSCRLLYILHYLFWFAFTYFFQGRSITFTLCRMFIQLYVIAKIFVIFSFICPLGTCAEKGIVQLFAFVGLVDIELIIWFWLFQYFNFCKLQI